VQNAAYLYMKLMREGYDQRLKERDSGGVKKERLTSRLRREYRHLVTTAQGFSKILPLVRWHGRNPLGARRGEGVWCA
jgi:hypothetical protein